MAVLVVCPLRFEQDIVRRTVRADATVVCCGQGAAAVGAWARIGDNADMSTVVLMGTAGALDPAVRAGTAHVVTEVIDVESGRTWTPPLIGTAAPCRIVEADTAVTGDARVALRTASDAMLVDMESVAFAHAAEAAGWRWGIIRGVSDDDDHELPPEAARFTTEDGRIRPMAIAFAIARRPRLVIELPGVRRRATDALRTAAELLDSLVV